MYNALSKAFRLMNLDKQSWVLNADQTCSGQTVSRQEINVLGKLRACGLLHVNSTEILSCGFNLDSLKLKDELGVSGSQNLQRKSCSFD